MFDDFGRERRDTKLFRARIPASRFHKAEKIPALLGIKPGDAFNMMLARIEVREGLSLEVSTRPPQVLISEQGHSAWSRSQA
jgi:antitoxin component of RelBE/YafQ-DinJ toxin-antitoxin module